MILLKVLMALYIHFLLLLKLVLIVTAAVLLLTLCG